MCHNQYYLPHKPHAPVLSPKQAEIPKRLTDDSNEASSLIRSLMQGAGSKFMLILHYYVDIY